MEDPRNIGLCTHLLFGAKNIAKRALAVSSENHTKPLMVGLKHMNELALG